jgi:hypothetical protein
VIQSLSTLVADFGDIGDQFLRNLAFHPNVESVQQFWKWMSIHNSLGILSKFMRERVVVDSGAANAVDGMMSNEVHMHMTVVSMFCLLYSRKLTVLDDEEFFHKQLPLSVEDVKKV